MSPEKNTIEYIRIFIVWVPEFIIIAQRSAGQCRTSADERDTHRINRVAAISYVHVCVCHLFFFFIIFVDRYYFIMRTRIKNRRTSGDTVESL